MRRTFAVGVVVALLSASRAEAQDAGAAARGLGSPGTVAVGVERLFGVAHASESNGPSITTIALLGPGGLEAGTAPYSVPRLAIDFFPVEGFSVGIGAQFAWMSSSRGSSDATVLGLEPRVGYALRLDEKLAFWPRAGLSYLRVSGGSDAYLLAASFELQLVFALTRHLAVVASPTFDVGVAATGNDLTQVGLEAGVLAWF